MRQGTDFANFCILSEFYESVQLGNFTRCSCRVGMILSPESIKTAFIVLWRNKGFKEGQQSTQDILNSSFDKLLSNILLKADKGE